MRAELNTELNAKLRAQGGKTRMKKVQDRATCRAEMAIIDKELFLCVRASCSGK